MVDTAFLYPSFKIILGYFIWEIENRMIWVQKIDFCIFIGYPVPLDIKFIRPDLWQWPGIRVAVILNNEVAAFIDILH